MTLPIMNDGLQFELTIPSTKEKVKARPWLAKEEKVLLFAYETKDLNQILGSIINIINACVDIPKDTKLTYFDVEYIFLQVRSYSDGETQKIKIKCPECETDNEINVNVKNVKISESKHNSYMPFIDDFGVSGTNKISIKLRYPSFEEIKRISGNGNINEMDEVKESISATELFELLSSTIDSVYMDDQKIEFSKESKESKQNFIESLTRPQLGKLYEMIENTPECYLEEHYTCIECKTDQTFNEKGLFSFFS